MNDHQRKAVTAYAAIAAAETAFRHAAEAAFPPGSVARVCRHSTQTVEIMKWLFGSRVRVRNPKTGKTYDVHAAYIVPAGSAAPIYELASTVSAAHCEGAAS
ncbi:MAG: hypothetical protein ABL308_12845 [Oceanicaulis sp.]